MLAPAVIAALAAESPERARDLDVLVQEGVVVVAGRVADYPEKLRLELAARHAHGVRALVSRLVTPFDDSLPPSCEDTAAASAALRALRGGAGWGDIRVFVDRRQLSVGGRIRSRSARLFLLDAIRQAAESMSLQDHMVIDAGETCAP